MKIAHVMRRLSFDDWGGTEQVVWNLAKAQMKVGHEVRIFATTALCDRTHEAVEDIEILRSKPRSYFSIRHRILPLGGFPFEKL